MKKDHLKNVKQPFYIGETYKSKFQDRGINKK